MDPKDDERRRRHRQAVEIHDNIVQGLALAKLSLELGEREAGMAALDVTLAAARQLVSDLLAGEDGGDVVDLSDGVLRRETPAGST